MENTQEQLRRELEGDRGNSVLVVSFKPEDRANVVSSVLKTLISDKTWGVVYVSISNPYEQLVKDFDSFGIDTKRMAFIDCISFAMMGSIPKKKENVFFVENPSSLEEVGMYVDRLLPKISGPKVILLDSLSSLLIYNDPKSAKEFTHLIISKMRLAKVGGIILSMEKNEAVEDLVRTILPMCDREIRL